MRRIAIALLPLCLLLNACAPEDRGASAPAPAVAPIVPVAPAADVAPTAPADEHAHHHDASINATLERPPEGGKWATDAPLRLGMARIHAAMADALPAFEKGELAPNTAIALAVEVRDQVQYLIANCKLEPAADAQLHLVIGQMLAAADALAKDPLSTEGMPRLHQSVQLYGEHFEHPGLHEHSGKAHHAEGAHEHDDEAADRAGD